MRAISEGDANTARRRRRLTTAIKTSLRELSNQLSLLNHQVGARLDLRDVDLDCLGDRDPDASDRRAVAVRPLRDRYAELLGLYAGMNSSMDQICTGYTDAELELLAGFLRRVTGAGREATDELAGD